MEYDVRSTTLFFLPPSLLTHSRGWGWVGRTAGVGPTSRRSLSDMSEPQRGRFGILGLLPSSCGKLAPQQHHFQAQFKLNSQKHNKTQEPISRTTNVNYSKVPVVASQIKKHQVASSVLIHFEFEFD